MTDQLKKLAQSGFFLFGNDSTPDSASFFVSPAKIACRDQGEFSQGSLMRKSTQNPLAM